MGSLCVVGKSDNFCKVKLFNYIGQTLTLGLALGLGHRLWHPTRERPQNFGVKIDLFFWEIQEKKKFYNFSSIFEKFQRI